MSSTLPKAYKWLLDEPGPNMLLQALKRYGTLEAQGSANNPVILQWAQETGLSKVYSADEIPWCGLFMAIVAKKSAKPLPTSPLWALSWSQWGTAGGQPRLGDVLTFTRPGGGHVGLYVGEDYATYHVLGGNQSDSVNITRIMKHRLHAVRRHYASGMPKNCRPIILDAEGRISHDEA